MFYRETITLPFFSQSQQLQTEYLCKKGESIIGSDDDDDDDD